MRRLPIAGIRVRRLLAFGMCIVLLVGGNRVYAVVGQAERFDEVREAELKEFEEALVTEEKKEQSRKEMEEAEAIQKTLKEKEKERAEAKGEEKEMIEEEVKLLKKQLLGLPKRDRFHIGLSGDYTYDSNIDRRVPRQEKGDSIFNLNGNIEMDLSGKKTDFRAEVSGGKQWNIKFSEKDFWMMEERIRYRRKYLKKISHGVHSRVSRYNEKTIEIDNNRTRWDSNQQTSLNYLLTRKFSLNGDFSLSHRLFTQEVFDQDSSWQVTMSPSLFWHVTPKSRLSAGYTFGANRIRTKTGDTNSHEVHVGYFGKVTTKSSASVDIGYSHQSPRSEDTSTVNTLTAGAGYIWQATPKTQLTIQYIYSLQNSTSAPPGGTADGIVKDETYFYNDSITVSMNSRLTRKITSTLTANMSHTRTKSFEGDTGETRQFTFPFTVSLTYLINRWARLRLSYTFSFRTGDEKPDTYRAHTLTAGLDLRF
jgi:hypothetical protein